MAHILVIELPGTDNDILQAISFGQHTFSFVTASLGFYQSQSNIWPSVSKAFEIIEIADFEFNAVLAAVLKLNAVNSIDAVICLIDIRLIEAAKIANRLGLHFLNYPSAKLLRDKYLVRTALKEAGIAQPEFLLATDIPSLKYAVQKIGLPLLIKPCDGYGSQNIISLHYEEDLDPILFPVDEMLPSQRDYGLGVKANDRLLIERCMKGLVIGCDVLTKEGKHRLLGIHEKLFYEHPSFAIRGGCFIPNKGQLNEIEEYINLVLNEINFDIGASHIELMMTVDGPRLIEINPRLVGAKIARLVGLALNRSMHADIINLHLGFSVDDIKTDSGHYAVTRWIVASNAGRLKKIQLPKIDNQNIRIVEVLKKVGDYVHPPLENADRIGYVMVTSENRQEAEMTADDFISKVVLEISDL